MKHNVSPLSIRIVFICLLFLINPSWAQDADSLRVACHRHPQDDTAKINQLIELSKLYREIDLDTALHFGTRAFSLSEKLQFPKGKAKAMNRVALVYKDRGKLDSALKWLDASVATFTAIGDRRGEANGYNNIGLTWDDKGDQPKASQSYKKALALFETLADYDQVAYTYTNMAQSERLHGNYLTAIALYLQAQTIYESDKMASPRLSQIAGIYNGMGIVYDKMEKYDESVSYFKKSLDIKSKTGNRGGAAVNQLNMANVYCKLKQFKLSEEYLTKALNHFRSVNYTRGICSALMSFGALYNEIGDLDKGIRYYTETLDVTRTLGYKEGEALALTGLAEIYLKKNALDETIRFSHQALKIVQENNLPEPAEIVNRVISQAYIKKGNFKGGYQHYVSHIAWRDSIFNKSKLQRLYALEKEFEINRKQAEINALEQRDKIHELSAQQQRYINYSLTAALTLVLIAAVIAYFILRFKTRLARKLKTGNEEILRLNQVLEIRALRSQMDSHFVFNALNGLQHFLTSQTAENSISYLGRVARLIRLTMQNASHDWVKLSEELEILKLYLQVEQYRFPGKFDFDFIVDPSAEHEKIPFLVIQPYVENAVLHGLLPRPGAGGKLTIRVEMTDEQMKVIIEDNGVGRVVSSKKADPMFTSMGSGLARERLVKLSLQVGLLMDAAIEDLKNQQDQSIGTRSVLTFGLQPGMKSLAA